jgi:hypothetical protein
MPVLLTSISAVVGLLLYMRLFAARLRSRQRELGLQFTHVAALLERRHAGLERLAQLLRLALPEARNAADGLARAAKTDLLALDFARRGPAEPRTLVDLAHARQDVEAKLRRAQELGLDELDEPGIARCLADLTDGKHRIETACRSFNAAAMSHNSARTRFPDALFARLLGIGPAAQLELGLAS